MKHDRDECGEYCSVQSLLDLGADFNAQRYKIIPLQMAVVMRDVHGVEVLLRAGADPNRVGDPEGLWWDSNTLLHRFTHLRGQHVLKICRESVKPNFSDGFIGTSGYDRLESIIEELLIEYGAKET